MPDGASISKDTADRTAQIAVVELVTAAIASINPSNAPYQKRFIKAFLAPDTYTTIAAEIDRRVKQMEEERELGSYYWVMTKETTYDPQLNRFFVVGEDHTVNAARDTGVPYVFEYSMTYENYRPVIHDTISYPGDKAHNSEWLKSNTKAQSASFSFAQPGTTGSTQSGSVNFTAPSVDESTVRKSVPTKLKSKAKKADKATEDVVERTKVHPDVAVKDTKPEEISLPGVMTIAGESTQAIDFTHTQTVNVNDTGSGTVV
eukprot:gene33886-39526_t